MSILWRYLFFSYIHIFSLSVCSFIAILLVSRLKEVAQFAALSSALLQTALFLLYQIPLILPIAIPISALIASTLLFQRLSRTFELTAFRASGMSLSSILFPVLLASSILSLCNFAFTAKIAPFCKRETKAFLYYETTSNPLLLLQRQNLVRVKNCYLKMDGSDDGLIAKNLTLITHNQSSNRLSLIKAQKLKTKNEELLGKNVALISHSNAPQEEMFDPLILENQQKMSTDACALSASLKKNRPRLDANSLEFPMLRLRGMEKVKVANKALIEMLRRITLSLAVFSFTLLGCTFGIEQSRVSRKRNLLISLGLMLLLMMSYLFGKECKNNLPLALATLLMPHVLIWLTCALKLRQIARGSA